MADEYIQKTNNFLNWFASAQGQIDHSKVELQDLRAQGRGRALIAKSPIPENTTVAAIPREAILSVESSDLLELIPDEFTELDQWNALVLCMIYETRPGAKWKPYMDVFPESFDTLVYWDREELEEMRGCEVVDRIKKEEAEHDFKTILAPVLQRHQNVFANTVVDFSNLEQSVVQVAHRMMTIIMSYSFDVQPSSFVSPDEDSDSDMDMDDVDFSTFFKGLVPMADMLNSDADIFNTRIFQSPTHLEVITLRDINPGEELLNDYGDLPRADLLRRYGYVTSNYAQYDLADLSSANLLSAISQAFGAPSNLQQRAAYLQELGLLEEQYDIDYEFHAPSDLYTAIKMMTIPDDQFESFAAAKSYSKASKAERVLYYPVIAQAIRERIRAYAPLEGRTPLEQIQDERKRRRVAMAREVVAGELDLLKKALQKAESAIL